MFVGCYFKTLSASDVCKVSERVFSHSLIAALASRSPIHHIAIIFLSNDRQQDDAKNRSTTLLNLYFFARTRPINFRGIIK